MLDCSAGGGDFFAIPGGSELLFNHEQELSSIRQDRRREDKLPGEYRSEGRDTAQIPGHN